MTYRDRQRVTDILTAIDAIRSHLTRGDLSDGLVFDAVRMPSCKVPSTTTSPNSRRRSAAWTPVWPHPTRTPKRTDHLPGESSTTSTTRCAAIGASTKGLGRFRRPSPPQRRQLAVPGRQQLPQPGVGGTKPLNYLRPGRLGHKERSSPSRPLDQAPDPGVSPRGTQPRRSAPPLNGHSAVAVYEYNFDDPQRLIAQA